MPISLRAIADITFDMLLILIFAFTHANARRVAHTPRCFAADYHTLRLMMLPPLQPLLLFASAAAADAATPCRRYAIIAASSAAPLAYA